MYAAIEWIRDVILALALGWLGVNVAFREEPPCIVKGADGGAACSTVSLSTEGCTDPH